MLYLVTLAKALTLAGMLHLQPGDTTLCPNQIEGLDDEEDNCRVISVSEQAGIVILVEDRS